MQRDFDRVFAQLNPLLNSHSQNTTLAKEGVDMIVTPTAPTLPPTIEDVKQQTPVESYMNDIFTVPASLAGLPSISIPVPLSKDEAQGLDLDEVTSVGMQVIGQFGQDEAVLDFGAEVGDLLSPSWGF